MNIKEEIEARDEEIEKLSLQLAGCSVAALGGTCKEVRASLNDYGWSPAYQDVLDLRLKYDSLRKSKGRLLKKTLKYYGNYNARCK